MPEGGQALLKVIVMVIGELRPGRPRPERVSAHLCAVPAALRPLRPEAAPP